MVFGSSPSIEQLVGESETLCCWKQQCFALLLLQKQNDGGTYGLVRRASGNLSSTSGQAESAHQQADEQKSLVVVFVSLLLLLLINPLPLLPLLIDLLL